MGAGERTIYTAILIACLVLGVIIYYFIISMIRQQKKSLALHKKNIVAEIAALEKERARIATDLHDEVGPMLAGIKLKINSFELSSEEDHEEVEKTSAHIDTVLSRMREISFDLMPDALLRKGIVAAIEQLINSLGQNSRVKIFFSADADLELPQGLAINIYRIVQEIFHNTIKHSKADRLDMILKRDGSKLILRTRDNGVGFDTAMAEKHTGFGLRSILSRTEMMGGEMFLTSEKGKGTEYQIEIHQ
jgi:two-component system, NarL family, sensor kinase